MWKFIGGVLLGIVVAFGYVRFDLPLPDFLQLPGTLKGNLVSTVTEGELYDLSADAGMQRRALEVYFGNQPRAAVEVDAAAGHPFLYALHRERARREARQLLAARSGFAAVLEQPALREALVRKHATTDEDALRAAMMVERLERHVFLSGWLKQEANCAGPDLTSRIEACARQ